ncbi:RNA pseudouridine synthase [Collibacillus ludicampi]|uniref:Pseudouridine synthase n=1 Tax=Collibacillus ludicampi TaxID=2771369 RepID=A0AAV4LK61_9BACL|nr:RluA family pseudouridine synthase [Collibacillus ludicampi]GIM48184.1 RNA pseudouridine synthase [Collibacillus ludicampi]
MENLKEIIRYRCEVRDEGKMVRQILQNRLGLSRRLIRRLVSVQGVRVNGLPAFLSSRVKCDDLLQLYAQEEASDAILPEPIELNIVYEDDHLLVVNKPAGMIVHPTRGHYTGTLANGAVYHWMMRGEKVRFRPVHRIDQYTSGLVLIAKTHFAHQQVAKEFVSHNLEREYHAIVHGRMTHDEGTVSAPIGLDPEHPQKRKVMQEGRPAVTHYRVVNRFADATWVKLRLETGRTHQIRVHMSHIGHPLFGDFLYGREEPAFIERQALHAGTLGIIHPRTKEKMVWNAPLPADMVNLIGRLS